jgi:hypothetical protein
MAVSATCSAVGLSSVLDAGDGEPWRAASALPMLASGRRGYRAIGLGIIAPPGRLVTALVIARFGLLCSHLSLK